jgi:hypothetical protein
MLSRPERSFARVKHISRGVADRSRLHRLTCALRSAQRTRQLCVAPGSDIVAGGGQILAEQSFKRIAGVVEHKDDRFESIILKPPRQLTLELALEYIEEGELVEVTPKAIRLRKMYLKENDRRRFARQAQS